MDQYKTLKRLDARTATFNVSDALGNPARALAAYDITNLCDAEGIARQYGSQIRLVYGDFRTRRYVNIQDGPTNQHLELDPSGRWYRDRFDYTAEPEEHFKRIADRLGIDPEKLGVVIQRCSIGLPPPD